MRVRIDRRRVRLGPTRLRLRDITGVAVRAGREPAFRWVHPDLHRRRVRKRQAVAVLLIAAGGALLDLAGMRDPWLLPLFVVGPGVLTWIYATTLALPEHVRIAPQHLVIIGRRPRRRVTRPLRPRGSPPIVLTAPEWTDALRLARALNVATHAELVEPVHFDIRAWRADSSAPLPDRYVTEALVVFDARPAGATVRRRRAPPARDGPGSP